ncbi:MAG: HPr family phosphocarrier protein [Lachnospiraceae bacterium]|nr:HPr family phosphocarrier protein [Lachnospiraceae bacterium]
MKLQDVEIKLKNGLEARPIALLVQVATQYDSRIYIQSGEKRVNAKSIMGMMTLVLAAGDKVTVSAEGEDEEAAVAAIAEYLSGNDAV